MTITDLLKLINEGLKHPLSKEDVFGVEVKVNVLKRIDKIFNKGLHYYLDPKSPDISKDASIFFRKSSFDVDLNIGARKIVNKFEEFKISLSGIAKLADINFNRLLPVFNIKQDPKNVAANIRKELYPFFDSNPKAFLKAFIGQLAQKNIMVFEFVETWNKKEKANIDGFFLGPNVIVLKRQQISFRREIFTLAHELAHYLINEEEIDELDVNELANSKLTAIERWCNDFAYYFLVHDYDEMIESLDRATGKNDYHFEEVEIISAKTHLSKIAIFTRLLYLGKISKTDYTSIKTDFDEQFRKMKEEEKKQREIEKAKGIKQGGAAPKPINSPLLISTIQAAFHEGIINEIDVCKTLNIKPDKLDKFLN